MDAWLGWIAEKKGRPFRDRVKTWFEQNTKFQVIPYEVSIKPPARRNHIVADQDYGDIDLLVIVREKKVIFPIECKNVSGGRNLHEIKTEVDLYLGWAGHEKNAKIRKHARRHEWLTTNKPALEVIVSGAASYTIHSIVLSADELSVPYLRSADLPVPVKSFVFLRMQGIKYLTSP